MDDNTCINNKIDILYNCIKAEGGIFDLPWCSELLYPYYKHFDDPNIKFRSGSIIAFCGLLHEWEDGSGFPFYTGLERYQCHDFEKYMKSFLECSSKIKADFPKTYVLIVCILKKLDERDNMNKTFPNIESYFIEKIRRSLFSEELEFNQEIYEEVLKEVNIIT